MNPLTNTKNLQKLNQRELELGLSGTSNSWHKDFNHSAWIFIGGLPYDLTEGDIITVFSQYGEVVNMNLIRDKITGKQKGYAFLCYEDQKSTILAVDNLNAIKILNRTIRVEHVKDYKMPVDSGQEDEVTKKVRSEGCGPDVRIEKFDKKLKKKDKNKNKEVDVWDNVKNNKNPVKIEIGSDDNDIVKKETEHVNNNNNKNKSENRGKSANHHNDLNHNDHKEIKIKEEKQIDGYDKYEHSNHHHHRPHRKHHHHNRSDYSEDKKRHITEKYDDIRAKKRR